VYSTRVPLNLYAAFKVLVRKPPNRADPAEGGKKESYQSPVEVCQGPVTGFSAPNGPRQRPDTEE